MKKLYAALLTAFDENGNIDEQGTRELVRYDLDVNQVDGLYVGGSTGENFLLGTDEKKKIFELVFDEVAGADVDLIAQVGSPNLHEAKELARFVTELGYQTISAVTPFYYNFSFEEIKNYYDEIVKDLDTQLIVYSIPALTGVALSLDNFARLFENEKIIGVKYTNADFYLLERLRERFPDKLILSGFDEMLLPALALDVDGAIGSTFNINAKKAKAEIKAFEAGDLALARKLQHESNDLITELLQNDLYASLKLILQEMGVHAGYTRAPLAQATPAVKENAKKIYTKYFS